MDTAGNHASHPLRGWSWNETSDRAHLSCMLVLHCDYLVFVTLVPQLGPISWSFNKNCLAGSGYSIEPEKVVRLPEGASAAFSASFQAR